jgi:hypothetical protein
MSGRAQEVELQRTLLLRAPQKSLLPNGTTNNYQKLSSKRFFRYQPGRVSSATFGVKYSTSTTATDVKKAGAFDDRDGYYLEVLGGAQTYGAGDLRQDKNYNFLAVRRSSAFETAASWYSHSGHKRWGYRALPVLTS